jgi:acyloxyacyl hydrolase
MSTFLISKDLFCSKWQQYGVVVLGDSAGAHFEIPPSYMNASEINKSTYSDLLFIVEDEFDWPQRSAYTGTPNTPE